MRTLDPSFGPSVEFDPIGRVVQEFEDAWRSGPPPLDRFRDRVGAADAPGGLVKLIKADLKQRFAHGERPAAREYLDRFPELAAQSESAVSLIFEEFCLRTEAGQPVDPADFCEAYPSWRRSLSWQLRCYRDVSRAIESSQGASNFPSVGDRFGDYELVEELGYGGSARVYLALSATLGGRRFALKVSPDRGGEAEILGQLDHPNIVPVFASVVDPATRLRWLCMAYRPGLTLEGLIRRFRATRRIPRRASELRALVDAQATPRDEREGPPPGWSDFPDTGSYAEAVAWIGLKVAQALAHAHGRGFIHRDVKPENVLLNGRDGPQLIDFNLADGPDLEAESRPAQRGGTLPYMAIEHLAAFQDSSLWNEIGSRADLFSLGMVLRELLTLRSPTRPSEHLDLPRELPEAVEAMIEVRRRRPSPIRRANRRVPHALEAIVARCLAPAAADRYPSAAELAEDLDRFLGRRVLRHVRNRSVAEVSLNLLRRGRSMLAAAGLAVTVAAALFALAPRREAARPPMPPPRDAARPAIAPTRETLQVLQNAVDSERDGRQPDADDLIQAVVQHADAIPALETVLRDHPGSLAIRLGLARAYESDKRFDDAERVYHEVLGHDPDCIGALVGLANVAKVRGLHADAIGWFDQVIDRARKLPSGPFRDALPKYRCNLGGERLALAEKSYDDGQFDDAASRFRDSVAEFERVDPIRKDGKVDRALALTREYFLSLGSLGQGRSLTRIGRPDLAVNVLREALDHFDKASKYNNDMPKHRKMIEDALDEALRAVATATVSR